jgi:hypothetical protein
MSRAGRSIVITGLAALLLAPFAGTAAAQQAGGEVKASAPVYKPPLRGAPGGRVGGAARGTAREEFILSVLAPDHTGLTTREQPALYWFISRPSSSPVELTLVDPNSADPVIETQIKPPISPGVHRIRLADYNVTLKPGVAYQWFVSVVPDSGRRSKDILSGGFVERIDPPGDLSAKLSSRPKSELPSAYADAGLWYDAVASLQELLEAAPKDAALLAQRNALLRQAGVPEIRVE